MGKEFNVTRERIRQIEAKALRKLRPEPKGREIEKRVNQVSSAQSALGQVQDNLGDVDVETRGDHATDAIHRRA